MTVPFEGPSCGQWFLGPATLATLQAGIKSAQKETFQHHLIYIPVYFL